MNDIMRNTIPGQTSPQIHLFYKQLGSGPWFQSYLNFQGFQGSELLNGCLGVWPHKQIIKIFPWFSFRKLKEISSKASDSELFRICSTGLMAAIIILFLF